MNLTTRALRKALSARILLSASLPSWTAGWESAASVSYTHLGGTGLHAARLLYLADEAAQRRHSGEHLLSCLLYTSAKWQFAAYLPECSCSQKVRDIILAVSYTHLD